jgi:hypothetical protein
MRARKGGIGVLTIIGRCQRDQERKNPPGPLRAKAGWEKANLCELLRGFGQRAGKRDDG